MKTSKSLRSAALIGWIVFANSASAQSWALTSAPCTNWSGIAGSADGSRLYAAAGEIYPVPAWGDPNYAAPIYVSTNSGLNWQTTAAPVAAWSAIGCSADGSTVAAGG